MVEMISAERVKTLYPPGANVFIIKAHTAPDIYPGARGRVICVDDNRVILIRLQSGRVVTAVYGSDYIVRDKSDFLGGKNEQRTISI